MTDHPPKKYHFICIPYLNLNDQHKEFDFGFAKIWNFDAKQNEYIKDSVLLQKLQQTFASYKAHFGIVRGVGIILVGQNDFRELNNEEIKAANDARLILFISHIARANTFVRNMNTAHSVVSSENYDKMHFAIVPEQEYITIYGGFVSPGIHGGVKIEENITIRPWHIPTPGNFYLDEDLMKELIKLRAKKKQLFRKIISAIEIFFEGYHNSTQISHNARILLQTSAFETLLDTATGEGRKGLKDFIKKHANYPEDRVLSYKSERKNGLVFERGTVKEKWADRFFTLRNHISHGYVPKANEYLFGSWQRHFDIALFFFIFCIKRKMEEILKRDIFNDDVVWKSWTDDLQTTPVEYTGFEYDGYGRRGWERTMAKINKRKKKII